MTLCRETHFKEIPKKIMIVSYDTWLHSEDRPATIHVQVLIHYKGSLRMSKTKSQEDNKCNLWIAIDP